MFPISYPTHSNQASITVEGTEFVIDSARAKEVSYDPYLKVLGMTWKSHWDIWYYMDIYIYIWYYIWIYGTISGYMVLYMDIWYYIWIYGTIYGYMVPYVAGIYAEQFMEVGNLRDQDDESLGFEVWHLFRRRLK